MIQNCQGALKSQPRGYSFRTSCYGIFQTIYVSKGELHFECFDSSHGSRQILTKGDFLVLRKESRFNLSSPLLGYEGVCYLDYSPDNENQRGYSFFISGSPWLIELTGLMEYSLIHTREYNEKTVRLIGLTMANQALFEETSPKYNQSVNPSRFWCSQIKKIIHNSLYRSQEMYLEQLSSLNLSYRQLSRIFLSETGLTIKDYQIKERIKEAKRLLLNTGFSITDIAYELHYSSSQKFASQFKKQTGITATEFKKNQNMI